MSDLTLSAQDQPTAGDRALADRLAELARSLHEQPDVEETLTAIVMAAVATVPDAQHASISAVRRRREVHTIAATGPLPREVDRAQYTTQQGPCLDSLYEQKTVRLPRLAEEERWPEFVSAAAELGVGSMLPSSCTSPGRPRGAEPHQHPRRRLRRGGRARRAAVRDARGGGDGRRAGHRPAGARRQLPGPDRPGQGILMERFRITDHQAFLLLVRASQAANAKLTAIAEELVRSGVLPSS
jgi:hypothetical protein